MAFTNDNLSSAVLCPPPCCPQQGLLCIYRIATNVTVRLRCPAYLAYDVNLRLLLIEEFSLMNREVFTRKAGNIYVFMNTDRRR